MFKKLFQIILLTISFLTFSCVSEQEQLQNYQHKARLCRYGSNYQKSIKYYEKALAVGKNINIPLFTTLNIYINLGENYLNIKKYDKALHYLKKAERLSSKTILKSYEYFQIFELQSMAYRGTGQFKIALEKAHYIYVKALKERKEDKHFHDELAAKYAILISSIYLDLDDFKNALKYMRQACDLAQNTHNLLLKKMTSEKLQKINHEFQIQTLTAKGLYFLKKKQFLKAYKYFSKLENITYMHRTSDGKQYAMANYYLGKLFLSKNEYFKAFEHVEKSINLIKKIDGENAEKLLYYELAALISYKLDNIDDAINFQHKAVFHSLKAYGSNNSRTVITSYFYALLLSRAKRTDEALSILEGIEVKAKKIFKPNSLANKRITALIKKLQFSK
ncbi:tetratricopeptide repeat protein [Lentisphaerota bacterium ZTH]|nr:tetratricopeptide repeat protein [Lentisphaerota bacterium]WET07509.1 tetratricopeptide repeat protein [Lentisphaerota bacterium ZTH]